MSQNKIIPDKWEEGVKRFLKAELAKRNIKHETLVTLLRKLNIPTTKAGIDNKLSRGTFGAAFMFQCLIAIGCKKIDLSDVEDLLKDIEKSSQSEKT